MKSNEKYSTYKQAEKKVKRIKNFYNHLQIFVIIISILLLFSTMIIDFFEAHIHNMGTLQWIQTNIWINALLWGIALAIHGIYAFKYKINFIDNWEKKKVEEIMNENK